MRIENWCGYNIRFVQIDGEWWAVLKDICDALKLRTDKVAQRLDVSLLMRTSIDLFNHPSRGVKYSDGRGHQNTRQMLVVNEYGIYEALFASRKLEARKFRLWTAGVLRKLRQNVGLEGYEIMRMTEPEIQDRIDWILDSLYWDEEKKCVMQSVTVQGGDVEQEVFFKEGEG